MLIEIMREAADYKIRSADMDDIAFEIRFENLADFVKSCVEIGLFIEKDGYFYSESLLRRMAMREEFVERLRKAGIKGAEKRWGIDGDPTEEECQPYANPIATPYQPYGNKGKERKVRKGNKEKKGKEGTGGKPIGESELFLYD